MKFYQTPATLPSELDAFEADIQDFVDGKVDPVMFKAIRVAHGVYEERQKRTCMIRIRCAAGGITPIQLKKVAELSSQYGPGKVHFTTRGEVQIHTVFIDDVMKVLRELHEVGLSARGGGGNTVRNIVTSADSGIAKDEVFDVDPYAIALTTRMISEPDSWNLPRKFKISFSSSRKDTGYTQAACLGFVATLKNGQKGFEVYCAGGMGAKSMVGHRLLDFIPDNKVYHVTRALKTMFDKNGNRRNRHANRIRFLWKKLGREEFLGLFTKEYDLIKDDKSLDLRIDPLINEANQTNLPVESVDGTDFETWKKRYVVAQKQGGLCSILVPLKLGDLWHEDAELLCDFLQQFSQNSIRCERGQNIRLRNMPEQYLGNAYQIIRQMDTMSATPAMLGNMVSCTGAEACKAGICLSKGLSSELCEMMQNNDLDLDAIPDFRIHISGCLNACSMHHIADLGFCGKAGRKSGNMFPAYYVCAGARVSKAGGTTYAEKLGEVPARHIPNFVYDFLCDYISKKAACGEYGAYLAAEGRDLILNLCGKYKDVPEYDDDPIYYVDFGAKERLSLEHIGREECSAGMFDMIDSDEKHVRDNRKILAKLTDGNEKANTLYKVLFYTSRMLLVPRGLDGRDERQVFELFREHFVQAGLVSKEFEGVIVLGMSENLAELSKHEDTILRLADEVVALYKHMDDSLRFPQDKEKPQETEKQPEEVVLKDFRGLACPMNFVKTKLVLESMDSGKKLEVLLDDGEPIENVPNSIELEGHKILETKKIQNYWSVLIKKN
jgi:sulfite reductase (ferredoxin)